MSSDPDEPQGLAAALAEAQQTASRYDLALRGSHDGLWDWDLVRDQVFVSARWLEMLGDSAEGAGAVIAPQSWFDRVHEDDIDRLREEIESHLRARTPRLDCQYRLADARGQFRWMLCRGLAMRGDDGKALRMAGTQTDVTDVATHDRLTGLPTRQLFLDRLDEALHRLDRGRRSVVAALYVDIDGFTLINDGLGRAWGDRFLKELADRLRVQLRFHETVARVGPDQFAVVLEDLRDVTDALRVAERIHIWLRRPALLNDHEVSATASVGIAVRDGGSTQAAQMLQEAETAMQHAKTAGGAASRVFDEQLSLQAERRLRLETDLERAIERSQLRVLLQPLIDLTTGRISGFEALVRWQRDGTGMISPADFIPLAERNGQIVPIGQWVLHEACRQLRDLQQRFGEEVAPSVNVNASVRQVQRYGFVDEVEQALRESGLAPQRLCIEITETALFQEADKGFGVLAALKDLGVQIALDDFGTGYSSLAYFERFPIDVIKIDRSFVSRVEKGGGGTRIIQAILTLAGIMGATVTAEGVETAYQLDTLRGMACPKAQGYFFAHPLEIDEVRTLLGRNPTW